LKPRIAILAGLLALVGAGAAEAQAIYVGPRYYDPGLPPYEIVRIVRANGLAPLSRPVRRGPTYMLAASDRSGRQLRVVVDARSGEILTVTPVLAMRSYGPWLASPYDPRILPVPRPPIRLPMRRPRPSPALAQGSTAGCRLCRRAQCRMRGLPMRRRPSCRLRSRRPMWLLRRRSGRRCRARGPRWPRAAVQPRSQDRPRNRQCKRKLLRHRQAKRTRRPTPRR